MTQTTGTGTRHSIAAVNKGFMEAFGRGDAAAVASAYTPGAQLLPPGGDVVTGTQAIQSFWRGVMDMGIKGGRLETAELEEHGDTAIEVGRYVLHGGEGQSLDSGKYIVIWKREAGQWRLHRDIWNSSLPPK